MGMSLNPPFHAGFRIVKTFDSHHLLFFAHKYWVSGGVKNWVFHTFSFKAAVIAAFSVSDNPQVYDLL